jgi:lysophospholipase L1-like esterase
MTPRPTGFHRFARSALIGLACLFALVSAGYAQDQAAVDKGPQPQRVVSASDPAFRYKGRLDLRDPAAPVVAWESSRISVDFSGASLSLLFGPATDQNFFNAMVDGESRIVAIEPGPRARIEWPGSLGPGLHHLVLAKRTEASAGSAAFRGIEIGPDATVGRPVAGKASLRMLFLGDSITAGACDEDGAVDQWEDRRTHNAEKSYAALTSGEFGADFENISVSGIGVVTGYVDVTFGEIWDRLYPTHGAPRADLASWRPDVVFLNLGGNDTSFSKGKGRPFPASFSDSYFKLVTEVRSAYPDAELVLLRGGMSETETDPVLIAAWTDAVRRVESQDRRSTHFVFAHYTDLHPRVADHRIMADELCRWLRGQPFMSPFLVVAGPGRIQDSMPREPLQSTP